MQTIVFDDKTQASFYPICLTRSVGDLRCGILKLRQRLASIFSGDEADNAFAPSSVIIAPRIAELYAERHPDWQINSIPPGNKLYLNSRLRVTETLIAEINNLAKNCALMNGEQLIAARSEAPIDINAPHGLALIPSELPLYDCLSDIIHDNARMLNWDFNHYFYDKDNYFETEPGVTVLHPYNVWIGEEVVLAPGVVLNAADGPIVLDTGVQVMANAVLTGPLYIGKNSIVKIGAKIYGSTSIGPVCKIGGEIEGSIFQAYSNKQHDGFLGHSYIGEWVNLGADTNNSDLKNTYKNVAYYSYYHKAKTDSGTKFLGCAIGDHSKTGINCSINTGCVIGIGSNLWGRALISDFIPDFSWGEADQLSEYRFEAFCQTAAIVKERRKLKFSSAETELYKELFSKHGE